MCFRQTNRRFFFPQVGYDAVRTVTKSSRSLGWHAMLPAGLSCNLPTLWRNELPALSALCGHAGTFETSAAVLACCICVNSPIPNKDKSVSSEQVIGLFTGFDPRNSYDFFFQRPFRLWCRPEVIWSICIAHKAVEA